MADATRRNAASSEASPNGRSRRDPFGRSPGIMAQGDVYMTKEWCPGCHMNMMAMAIEAGQLIWYHFILCGHVNSKVKPVE